MRWRGWVVASVCGLSACGSSHRDPGASPGADAGPDADAAVGACTSTQVIEDRDGDGVPALWTSGCGRAPYPIAASGAPDCDDTDPAHYQLAWTDRDGDGWSVGGASCVGQLPAGFTTGSAGPDCDDHDAAVQTLAYVDQDRDGFGAGKQCIPAVASGAPVPDGFALVANDCDDQNTAVHPGVLEQWRDGVDSDCDGRDDPLPCAVPDPTAGDPTCGCALLNAPTVATDPSCAGPALFVARQAACTDCLERNIFIVGNRGTVASEGFDFVLGEGSAARPFHVVGALAPGAVSLPVVVRYGFGATIHLANRTNCGANAGMDEALIPANQCLTP